MRSSFLWVFGAVVVAALALLWWRARQSATNAPAQRPAAAKEVVVEGGEPPGVPPDPPSGQRSAEQVSTPSEPPGEAPPDIPPPPEGDPGAPADTELEEAPPEVENTLRAAIAQVREVMRPCYDRFASGDPKPSGVVLVGFTLEIRAGQGTILDPQIADSDVSPPALESCFADSLASAKPFETDRPSGRMPVEAEIQVEDLALADR